MASRFSSSLQKLIPGSQFLVRWFSHYMPKGLYARALLILILPMVLLQSAVAYFFLERHLELVTFRLSAAVVQDIAAILALHEVNPPSSSFKTDYKAEYKIAKILGLEIHFDPPTPLPPPLPAPFFSLLNTALSRELSQKIPYPFWLDTATRSDRIEIRLDLGSSLLRIIARRRSVYASNSHIFFVWMVGTSLFILCIAVAFLRNQIRPILKLARAAESFGKGRDSEFHPHGAREVRQAGYAFIEMKRRIERAMDQRTTMLNGVSHDLRTILTRYKLSLALLDNTHEVRDLQRDVEQMERILESYLSFARGDTPEDPLPIDLRPILEALKTDAERHGHPTQITLTDPLVITVRPEAFKRCLFNLLSNAQRYGKTIAISATTESRWMLITIEDDGPGIPSHQREEAFRPFTCLDESRNQDEGRTGLGLTIARDIARAHGGDILLSTSPLGGLKAALRLPL